MATHILELSIAPVMSLDLIALASKVLKHSLKAIKECYSENSTCFQPV